MRIASHNLLSSRPPPVAEKGRDERGSGQNILTAFMPTKDVLGTATRKVVGSNPAPAPKKANDLDDI